MAQTLSTTTYPLSYNTVKAPVMRAKETVFGDGYRQITIDGTNYQMETWSVDWVLLVTAKADTLEDLLLNSINGTDNYLLWQGPGQSTAKYYTAHDIGRIPVSSTLWKITATFRREFPLV